MAGATINQMRSKILEAYPNASMKWRQKVTNMKTSQVVAIYRSVLAREEKLEKQKAQDKKYHQIDIWEWLTAQSENSDEAGSHTLIEV